MDSSSLGDRNKIHEYRDYLRGVWVDTLRQLGVTESDVDSGKAEAQLDGRFYQNFHTLDSSPRPVIGLLIPILRAALTAPLDHGGFGFKPDVIPPQGELSDAEWLEQMVAISKVSKQALRNRYRVSFDRRPDEISTPIELNVEALLGLLTDSFQSPPEPFPADPAIKTGRPLIGPHPQPGGWPVALPPFFLQCEEWAASQAPFFPENLYDIQRSVPRFPENFKQGVKFFQSQTSTKFGKGYFDMPKSSPKDSADWLTKLYDISDKLILALDELNKQDYNEQEVNELLRQADDLILSAVSNYPEDWIKGGFTWEFENGKPVTELVSLEERSRLKVTTLQQLQAFEAFFDAPRILPFTGQIQPDAAEIRLETLAQARTCYIYCLLYLSRVTIPYLHASMAIDRGSYADAIRILRHFTGYWVGIAERESRTGYNYDETGQLTLWEGRSLPYTIHVRFDDSGRYVDQKPWFYTTVRGVDPSPLGNLALRRFHSAPFEQRFFKLRQGDAMLSWADLLYRLDEPSAIRRARELYKGVIFMHGEDPDIAPHFPKPGSTIIVKPPTGHLPEFPIAKVVPENPAKQAQLARAFLGYYQIEHGLNAYGYRGDMVPVLRHRPLKTAADLFAVSAKSAQSDFLNYLIRVEQADIDYAQTQAMMSKAEAAAGIATQLEVIAQSEVDKARDQLKAIESQIAAKKAEIADKSSFITQAGDFLTGMKESIKELVPLGRGLDDQAPAQAGTDAELASALEKITKAGSVADAEQLTAGSLGSGAAFMIGYGAFVYTGYTSMSSMADAANKRNDDLHALEAHALPAAEAVVHLKERGVRIAQFEGQVARADLDLGKWLLQFHRGRTLNREFWRTLTAMASRTMYRYLDLGGRTAWFAERALAFEQNRRIRVIRLSYHNPTMRDVSGADQLLADLAEIEAARIQGLRETVPIKHTISLARTFPLAFGQLKKTGVCRFRTTDEMFRTAYPGTFSYRIRALTVGSISLNSPPPRGLISNKGFSIVSGEAPKDLTALMRFPDALPISEFRVRDDMFLYGLPGDALMQFEGSGVETEWEVELPQPANPQGLRSLADLLVTLDVNAFYNPNLDRPAPGTTHQSLLVSANSLDSAGVNRLHDGHSNSVSLQLDLSRLPLPADAARASITNLAIFAVGSVTVPLPITLSLTSPETKIKLTMLDGVDMSNSGTLNDGKKPRPLNAAVGAPLAQVVTVTLKMTDAVEGQLARLRDLGLWAEFEIAR